MKFSIPCIAVIIGLYLLPGCALLIHDTPYRERMQDARDTVALARENVNAVKRLHLEDVYPDIYAEAAQKLTEAEMDLATLENLVRSNGDNSREIAHFHASVREKAEDSQAASQRILRSHYLEQITPMLEETAEQYDEIQTDDRDHPLGKYKPLVAEIARRTENVRKQQEVLTLTEVIDDINTLLEADTLLDANIQSTLRLDVLFFDPGQYEPDLGTKQVLEELVRQILSVKEDIRRQQPDSTLTVHIKSVGYADEMDFEKRSLIQLLTRGLEAKVPEERVSRRKFLNQRLSEYRARSAVRFLGQRLLQADRNLHIQQEIIGKGEEIPQELTPPYSASDPRRRICKVYAYIIQ